MDREVKRISKKKALERKQRRTMAHAHLLIAVVALIECFILIAFTTYSWIESSSSLIIQNGRQTSIVEDIKENYVSLDITNELNYRVDLDTAEGYADINDFFRNVKYYEFAKGTSPDGTTFFFPRRNNTNGNSHEFRRGDTTDYNTSYYYYDFVVNNVTNAGKDFYFDPETCFTVNGQKTIFDVTGGDAALQETYTYGGETNTRLEALRRAMRMSITTRIGTGASETKMYSATGTSGYLTINPNAPTSSTRTSPADADIDTAVTTHNITDYVYATRDNVPTSSKLFNARKGKETKVSVRIWFDLMDPDFQTAFGFNPSSGDFDTKLFKAIPSADIGIKFGLVCYDNDYQAVYFDDYTFSNLAAATHLTDERSDYKMFFYAYQPATSTPQRNAGYVWLEMTKDSSSEQFNRWYTGDASIPMMATESTGYGLNGQSSGGMYGTYLTNAKFVYANSNHSTILYEWKLPSAPGSDYYFNAYSYTPYSTTSSGTLSNSTKSGVGVWDDGDANSMMLLRFKDVATANTSTDYNVGTSSDPSFKFMNAKAESDIAANSGSASKYLLFVNNSENGTSYAANYTEAVAKTTAAMYYDASSQLFMSYVPKKWLVGSANGVYFSYCPDGFFSQYATTERWFGAGPNNTLDGTYTFKALGYTGDGLLTESGKGSVAYHGGVGTWGDYHEIKFSTELIDTDALPSYRYYIGVQGYSRTNDWNYYSLIPNVNRTSFSAYVPVEVGEEAAEINFLRYSDYRGVSGHTDGTINAYWYGNRRYSYTTFYPVTVNSAASAGDYTRGYWNLSVLVDGTYENLIYDTLTDDDAIGTLAYSTDNTNWITIADNASSTFDNKLDRYRFYAPAENVGTIYWKWTPYPARSVTVDDDTVEYTATEFIYTHDTSTGIYKLITESANSVSATGIPEGHTGDYPVEETPAP